MSAFSRLPCNHPDGIRVVFDGQPLLVNAGLLLPASLGLAELVKKHLDLRTWEMPLAGPTPATSC